MSRDASTRRMSGSEGASAHQFAGATRQRGEFQDAEILSGIPATVHDGTATEIRTERGKVLAAAYAANPARFGRPPTPPRLPAVAWINEPAKENINTEFVA